MLELCECAKNFEGPVGNSGGTTFLSCAVVLLHIIDRKWCLVNRYTCSKMIVKFWLVHVL